MRPTLMRLPTALAGGALLLCACAAEEAAESPLDGSGQFSEGVQATLDGAPQVVEGVQVPLYSDETESSGFDQRFSGGRRYVVGGGVASLDCDGNGLVDLFVAGGAEPAKLFRNVGTPGGALAFETVPDSPLALTAVTGAYALDVDADGQSDLAVLRFGENVLFRGLGDCAFERANEAWGFDGGSAWSTAFAAIWEAGQDWPTLAIGNYIDLNQPGAPWGTCFDNSLHRPRPDGGYSPPLALAPGHCALSMLFTDWNGDGLADLRVSNDRQYYREGEEQLWHVPPGGSPRLYTREEGWAKLQVWGMGIASHDITGNGLPDYFLTSMADNKLRTLDEGARGPAYRDIAYARGVTAHRPYVGDQSKPSTAWHADFQDVNNDGLVDLFVAKGNVGSMDDFALQDPNNLLLGLPDGRFVEAGDRAGLDSTARGRGAAIVDLNADGLLDVVVVNRNDAAQVWRNRGIGGLGSKENWVRIRLNQKRDNRDAVGAWVELRTPLGIQRREVLVGGGHAGGGIGWMHFGLGPAQAAEVRVRWPYGRWGPWLPVVGSQFVEVTRNDRAGDRTKVFAAGAE